MVTESSGKKWKVITYINPNLNRRMNIYINIDTQIQRARSADQFMF